MVSKEVRKKIENIIEIMEISGTAYINDVYNVREKEIGLNEEKKLNKKELQRNTREIEVKRQEKAREINWKELNISNKEGREGYLDKLFSDKMALLDNIEFKSFYNKEIELANAKKQRDLDRLDFLLSKDILSFELNDMQHGTISTLEEFAITRAKEKLDKSTKQ